MADILSWHDSEVRQIVDHTAVDGTVHIVLSAACVHRRLPGASGKPGDMAESVWGFVKPLEVILRQARMDGPLAECLGSVSHGELQTNADAVGAQSLRTLPLPWHTSSALQLTLQFHNGSVLSVRAQGASCEVGPDARFIEYYAC